MNPKTAIPLTENSLAAALDHAEIRPSYVVCGNRAAMIAKQILWSHDPKSGERIGPLFGLAKVAIDPHRHPDDWELF
jgi:hypothetical protein